MITEFVLFEQSENSLFEDIKNDQLMKYYFHYIYSKLSKWLGKKGIDFKRYGIGDGNKTMYTNIVIYSDDKIVSKLESVLKQLKRNLLYHNIIFSYYISLDNKDVISLKTYLKNIKLKRVVPDNYVYHTSPTKNKDSILKYGLIPKDSIGRWDAELEYPPAIFAIDKGRRLWSANTDKNVWRINTIGLSNIWWMDLNGIDKAIMTFDPIPPNHLDLLPMSSKDFEYRR